MHRDRLSDLPEPLIHHILSFLPMRDVVSTTLLSKHWENLWTTVPCLNFYEEGYISRRKAERIQNFVNRTLILWKGINILKFKIDIRIYFDSSLAHDVHEWVLFAVKYKVQELEVITSPVYSIPHCLYSCSSIRKLSLVGCSVQFDRSPSWNQLKSLRMHVYCDDQELMINRILLGSPELEVFELRLRYKFENMNIESRSLKKLKIANPGYFDNGDGHCPYSLRICCPNLETLEIIGLFGKCLFTDVSSLIDATLDFNHSHSVPTYLNELNELLGVTLRQFFSTIQHLEKVSLSDLCFQVICASRKKYSLSPLPNVKFLKLDVRRIEFSDMMYLLGIFPNLKMLVAVIIESVAFPGYMEFERNLSESFLLQLKIVDITLYLCDFSIFGYIEFLLKHAIRLEKLVLRPREIISSTHKMFSEKLLSLPRSSPTAEVILENN